MRKKNLTAANIAKDFAFFAVGNSTLTAWLTLRFKCSETSN